MYQPKKSMIKNTEMVCKFKCGSKSLASSKLINKNEKAPIGECIHCHQKKPVKLGECHKCYQNKKKETLPPSSEPIKKNENNENIPIEECIHCHQKKPVKLGEYYK